MTQPKKLNYNALEEFLQYFVNNTDSQKVENGVSLSFFADHHMLIFSRDKDKASNCFFDCCSLPIGVEVQRVEADFEIAMIKNFLLTQTGLPSDKHSLTLGVGRVEFHPSVVQRKLDSFIAELLEQGIDSVVEKVITYQKEQLVTALGPSLQTNIHELKTNKSIKI